MLLFIYYLITVVQYEQLWWWGWGVVIRKSCKMFSNNLKVQKMQLFQVHSADQIGVFPRPVLPLVVDHGLK